MAKRRMRQFGAIERDLFEQLSAGDLLYGFLLSARSSKRMMRLAYQRANDRYRRKRAIERLAREGFIRRSGERLSITERGEQVLGTVLRKTRAQLTSSRWDHKWRIATFDIPEKYAPLRTKVRRVLKRTGFVMLQRSLWVFPHECEELVQLIKKESRLSPYLLYGVLERIENEERLIRHFKLDRS